MWFLFLMRLYVVSFPYEVVCGFFSLWGCMWFLFLMRLYVVSFPYEVVCGFFSL